VGFYVAHENVISHNSQTHTLPADKKTLTFSH